MQERDANKIVEQSQNEIDKLPKDQQMGMIEDLRKKAREKYLKDRESQ